MRYPVSSLVQAWPLETQRKLRFQCLEKYKWVYIRQTRLQQQLFENTQTLENSKKITDTTNHFYPTANSRTKEKFLDLTMQKVENNDLRFLATNNRRYNFFQKEIKGSMDTETE